MWGTRPKAPLSRGKKMAAAVLLLLMVALFAAIFMGGGRGRLSLGAYEVDYTVLSGVLLLALGVIALVLRRPRL